MTPQKSANYVGSRQFGSSLGFETELWIYPVKHNITHPSVPPEGLGKLPDGSRVGGYGKKLTQELHSTKRGYKRFVALTQTALKIYKKM